METHVARWRLTYKVLCDHAIRSGYIDIHLMLNYEDFQTKSPAIVEQAMLGYIVPSLDPNKATHVFSRSKREDMS